MYKIRFLESINTSEAGNVSKICVENIFSDGKALTKLSQSWKKVMGFKRVESIEVMKGGKLSKAQVVEMFYPEQTITEEEAIIKAELLGKEIKSDTEDDKLKALLVEEAKSLGIKVTGMMKAETIQKKIDEAKESKEEEI